jgi:hypothetical protein
MGKVCGTHERELQTKMLVVKPEGKVSLTSTDINLLNYSCNYICAAFTVCSVSFIVCVVLCVVFCLTVVCYFVWCALFVCHCSTSATE